MQFCFFFYLVSFTAFTMPVKSVRNQNTVTQIMIPKLSLYIVQCTLTDLTLFTVTQPIQVVLK